MAQITSLTDEVMKKDELIAKLVAENKRNDKLINNQVEIIDKLNSKLRDAEDHLARTQDRLTRTLTGTHDILKCTAEKIRDDKLSNELIFDELKYIMKLILDEKLKINC